MERTYVFNQDGGAGSSNGLLASILPSLQNRGIDTGYLMGLMGGNGNGGFFGNNGGFQDIIALIVIAAIFGNGNFGYRGNNTQGANEGREMIISRYYGLCVRDTAPFSVLFEYIFQSCVYRFLFGFIRRVAIHIQGCTHIGMP